MKKTTAIFIANGSDVAIFDSFESIGFEIKEKQQAYDNEVVGFSI